MKKCVTLGPGCFSCIVFLLVAVPWVDLCALAKPMRGSKGGWGQGVRPLPLEKHKATEYLSKTGLDPLENQKATKPSVNVGPLSARQRMPFKWHSLAGRIRPACSGIWIISPLINNKK